MTKGREMFIDYAKAIGILFIACAHAGIVWVNYIGYMIMTLFFFASGYTANYEKYSVAQNIKKLFKKLMLPFWGAMLFYGVFEIFRARYFGYADADIFLPAMIGLVYGTSQKVPVIPGISGRVFEIMSFKPGGSEFLNVMLPTNCHLWFLPAFFTGAVLYILYLRSVGKSRKPAVDVMTVLALLALSSVETFAGVAQLPYCLGRGFYCCACMIAGRIFRERGVFDKYKGYRAALPLLAAAVAAYLLGGNQSALVRSEYGPFGVFAPVQVYVGGISATVLLLFILKKIPEKPALTSIAYLGQNTMPVYLWHMGFISVISVLLIKLTGLQLAQDIWFMAIIPETNPGLMVLAAVLSVLCCLGLDRLKKSVSARRRAAASE